MTNIMFCSSQIAIMFFWKLLTKHIINSFVSKSHILIPTDKNNSFQYTYSYTSIYSRVEWFFDFQMATHTVVPNYPRSPNPKYDPLKLHFSICARPLKVLPFLKLYSEDLNFLPAMTSEEEEEDKSAGSLCTFSWRGGYSDCTTNSAGPTAETVQAPPPPPSPAWSSSKVRKMARTAAHLPVGLRHFQTLPPGPAWPGLARQVCRGPRHFSDSTGWPGRAESAPTPCRLVPPPPTGQIQSRPLKPSFYREN